MQENPVLLLLFGRFATLPESEAIDWLAQSGFCSNSVIAEDKRQPRVRERN